MLSIFDSGDVVMIHLLRTNSKNLAFIDLVKQLDADLARRDGVDHSFYHQFNKIDNIQHVVIAYDVNRAIGCGAIKKFSSDTMEVKRIYVLPEFRGKGVARRMLEELENWTVDLNLKRCVLETGARQPEAIRLYKKSGYQSIPNYGQYIGIANSLCFEKVLF